MIKTKQQLALNLIKIYRIKIDTKNSQGITHYSLQDYGYKPFIFTKDELHDLIIKSAKYHGFKPKYPYLFCAFIRKMIDERLVFSNEFVGDYYAIK